MERLAWQPAPVTQWKNLRTGQLVPLTPPPDPDPADPRADFVIGTTVPTLTNTGVLPGVARTQDTRTAITGTTTETIQNKTFPNTLVLSNCANKTFYNCLFEGRTGSSECVTAYDLENRNLKFIDCTFSQPASMFPLGYTGTSGGKMGIRAHHTTLLRCQFTNVVDGFRPRYNTGDGLGDCAFVAQGCFIDKLLFLSPDGGQADRQSHNDCVQDDMVYGQKNVKIEGCWMNGHINMNLTQAPYPVSPTGWVTGSTATRTGGNTMYPLSNCTNVMQLRDSGGVGTKDNYIFINNWFFGGSTIINAGGTTPGELDLTFTGNRIGRDMRLGEQFVILIPNTVTLTAFSGNTYYDNGAPANYRKNG